MTQCRLQRATRGVDLALLPGKAPQPLAAGLGDDRAGRACGLAAGALEHGAGLAEPPGEPQGPPVGPLDAHALGQGASCQQAARPVEGGHGRILIAERVVDPAQAVVGRRDPGRLARGLGRREELTPCLQLGLPLARGRRQLRGLHGEGPALPGEGVGVGLLQPLHPAHVEALGHQQRSRAQLEARPGIRVLQLRLRAGLLEPAAGGQRLPGEREAQHHPGGAAHEGRVVAALARRHGGNLVGLDRGLHLPRCEPRVGPRHELTRGLGTRGGGRAAAGAEERDSCHGSGQEERSKSSH